MLTRFTSLPISIVGLLWFGVLVPSVGYSMCKADPNGSIKAIFDVKNVTPNEQGCLIELSNSDAKDKTFTVYSSGPVCKLRPHQKAELLLQKPCCDMLGAHVPDVDDVMACYTHANWFALAFFLEAPNSNKRVFTYQPSRGWFNKEEWQTKFDTAMAAADPRLCPDTNRDFELHRKCLFPVFEKVNQAAAKSGNVLVCDRLSTFGHENFLNCVQTLAAAMKRPDLCVKYFKDRKDWEIERCFEKSASLSACKLISDPEMHDYCLQSLGECDLVSNGKIKFDCQIRHLDRFSLKSAHSFCDGAKEPGDSEHCYIRLINDKMNNEAPLLKKKFIEESNLSSRAKENLFQQLSFVDSPYLEYLFKRSSYSTLFDVLDSSSNGGLSSFTERHARLARAKSCKFARGFFTIEGSQKYTLRNYSGSKSLELKFPNGVNPNSFLTSVTSASNVRICYDPQDKVVLQFDIKSTGTPTANLLPKQEKLERAFYKAIDSLDPRACNGLESTQIEYCQRPVVKQLIETASNTRDSKLCDRLRKTEFQNIYDFCVSASRNPKIQVGLGDTFD